MEQSGQQVRRNTQPRKQAGVFRSRQAKIIGLVVAAGLLAAGGSAYHYIASQPVLNKSLVSEVTFAVYAPLRAPAGYKLQDDQTRIDSSMVSYVFVDDSADRRITVTTQPTPGKFDISQLVEKGSIQSTATKNGMLYDLSTDGSTQYLLNTGDSLLFFTSPTAINTATINALADGLVKVN